ncbi:hypothetical protein LGR51_21885 [Pseudomonas sp. NP21570]|uniref:hypothetical protein n=1 Tax=Stutzerimonas kunmingensis TaxID=1211807 RepID=UPI001E377F04|nr:hypothetical protein [Stutzerimonas kunmingensis]MCB4797138.1 hypothetical protein [Pseudomonas sp. NP21570]
MNPVNSDDQDFPLDRVLIEAAFYEAAGSGRMEAFHKAGDQVTAQLEAERTGEVVLDEEGYVESYYEDELNGPNLSATNRFEAARIYHELCDERGVEPLPFGETAE